MRCFVPSCENSKKNTTKLHVFSVPAKKKQTWCEILGLDVDSITENSRVCIKHFEETDYFQFAKRIKLKTNAIPKPMPSSVIEDTEQPMEIDIKNEPVEDLTLSKYIMEEYTVEAMKYFTSKEWTKLDRSEQMKYGQILYIYYACVHLGISVIAPDFMVKQKIVKEELLPKKKNRINKCLYCETTYALKKDCARHMKVCRKRFDFIKKMKHVCDTCNYSSDKMKYLTLHKLTHTKEKRYVCSYCHKAFAQGTHLKRHIRGLHLKKENNFKCDKCPYSTYDKNILITHSKNHLNVKTFVCEICNKGFNQKYSLTVHSYLHNNKEKPCKCTKCEKSFLNERYLTNHINKVHLKLKKYKCNQCDYSTSSKYDIKIHTYSH